MVTESQALEKFDAHFKMDQGSRTWNTRSQRVDVHSHTLELQAHVTHMRKIPVPLGELHVDLVMIRPVGLTTLENGPTHVHGDLHLEDNDLTSLAHAPVLITGDLNVSNNQLITFDAAHTTIQGDLHAKRNHLSDVQGVPHVHGVIMLTRNWSLTNLKHLPDQVNHLIISYYQDLPLLPLLKVQGELRFANVPTDHQYKALHDIFNNPKYHGKGKHMMLNVAQELRRAGFPDSNIKW